MPDPRNIRQLNKSHHIDKVLEHYVEDGRSPANNQFGELSGVTPIKGTEEETDQAIKLFSQSVISKSSLGNKVYNVLLNYHQNGKIVWKRKGSYEPAGLFDQGTDFEFSFAGYKKTLMRDYGKEIWLNLDNPLDYKIILIHEGVHAAQYESGETNHPLISELTAFQFATEYYMELRDDHKILMLASSENKAIAIKNNRLIDEVLGTGDYVTDLDARFVTSTFLRWGGIRNRTPKTRGLYASVLIAAIESEGKNEYSSLLVPIALSPYTVPSSDGRTKPFVQMLKFAAFKDMWAVHKGDDPKAYNPSVGAMRLLNVFPSEYKKKLLNEFNKYNDINISIR